MWRVVLGGSGNVQNVHSQARLMRCAVAPLSPLPRVDPCPAARPTPPTAGSTLRNANALCAVSTLAGFVVLVLAFNASKSFGVFMGLFGVGQLIIFLLQVGACCMHAAGSALSQRLPACLCGVLGLARR